MNTDDKLPLEIGRNCWRIERADKARMIVDAADYYALLEQLMADAKQRILLIGWDFDARIHLGDASDGGPPALGDFVMWLARRRPTLHVRLLRWDTGALKAMFRGSTLLTILRWKISTAISNGTVIITPAAMMVPQGVSKPYAPVNFDRATIAVYISGEVPNCSAIM